MWRQVVPKGHEHFLAREHVGYLPVGQSKALVLNDPNDARQAVMQDEER